MEAPQNAPNESSLGALYESWEKPGAIKSEVTTNVDKDIRAKLF
jgi:hypothetical protein